MAADGRVVSRLRTQSALSAARTWGGTSVCPVGAARVRVAALCALYCLGCAGSMESGARRELRQYEHELNQRPAASAEVQARLDQGLPGYVGVAMEQNPELRAAFESWRASVERIGTVRTLPDPTLNFGVFVRSVETRVGPQLARVGVSQSFPWPTRLGAASEAAAGRARAQYRRLDAATLMLTRRVSEAYWQLWKLRRTHQIHSDHLNVLRGLSETVRARFVTGSATLADQQQIDLAAARLEDSLQSTLAAQRVAAARLSAALSLPEAAHLPTPTPPPAPRLPEKDEAQLRALAMQHPLLDAYVMLIQADEAEARSREAAGYPSFSIGLDWIITGESDMPDVPDSGKDAIAVTGGIGLPLWRGSYADAASAARAEKRANEARLLAARDVALAELRANLSDVEEGVRRVKVYESTLLPQADAAYSSVLGAYATGRATVASTLLAQQELLRLRVELEEIRAEQAMAWARLEEVVGAPLDVRQSAAEPGAAAPGVATPGAAATEAPPNDGVGQ